MPSRPLRGGSRRRQSPEPSLSPISRSCLAIEEPCCCRGRALRFGSCMVRVAVAVLAMAARVLALGPRVKTSWIAAMSNREVELAVTSTAKTRVRVPSRRITAEKPAFSRPSPSHQTRGAAGLGPESDVAAQVRAGDVVLELGGQLGETSSRIAAQCSRLLARRPRLPRSGTGSGGGPT